MSRYFVVAVGLLGALANAAPTAEPEAVTLDLGVHFSKDAADLPLLKLPYATYRASSYDKDADMYKFTNVRFGAPPVGHLRWQKPAPPAANTTIQDGKYGPSCVQGDMWPILKGALPPGLPDSITTSVDLIANAFLDKGMGEDCLFLDVYVPAKALKSPETTKLPVIVWIFGGGYIFGSKELVEMTGVVKSSGGNAIVVSGNYRLGAYGWLGGPTVEGEGVPNAALWDQRAVLQWVQDWIHLVGGDKKQVSAWGESAGGGSIMHHLVGEGGKLDPLFNKAVLQSPAYNPIYDRKGTVEDAYKKFEKYAGCAGKGLDCLRKKSTSTLTSANNKQANEIVQGTIYAFGPVPDGTLIRQLPQLELAQGNFWKGIDSLIVSHVRDEALIFVDQNIKTNQQWADFLRKIEPEFEGREKFLDELAHLYPPINGTKTGIVSDASMPKSPYKTEFQRTKAFVQDAAFTCLTRSVASAYENKTYLAQYSVTPGFHATDLAATFNNDGNFLLMNELKLPLKFLDAASKSWQSYLTSHAITGNPNTRRIKTGSHPTIQWPLPKLGGEEVTNVLDAGDKKFSLIKDTTNLKSHCDFFVDLETKITKLLHEEPSA
jgi:carboxylesterase type B